MTDKMAQEESAESKSRLQRWFEKNNRWLRSLIIYIGLVAAVVTGVLKLQEATGQASLWLIGGLTLLPFLAYFFADIVPNWRERQHRKRLLRLGEEDPEIKDPGYFRLKPYEEADQQRYTRADKSHERVLRWIRAAEDPVLFLTGRSGTGKSSLLSAAVLPELKASDAPWRVVSVRSFEDPTAALVIELTKPGFLWKQPPSEDDPRTLLENACKRLQTGERLLIVLDQFEEFVILHDDETRKPARELLRSLEADPIPGLTTLLVFRTDYMAAYNGLDLPKPTLDGNWQEIGPFTEADAESFLEGSGLKLSKTVKEAVLREAQEIEETKGLIRPITLNMFGMILGRYHRELPKGVNPGALMRSYLRGIVNQPEIRETAPKVLRPMITDSGTKQPRTVEEIVGATRLRDGQVRGCLLELAGDGVVRRLDRAAGRWEISHDFVARLLDSILERWRSALVRRLRPAVAPLSLALWAGALVALPWMTGPDRVLATIGALDQLGCDVQEEEESGYAVSCAQRAGEQLVAVRSRLNELPGRLSLDLSSSEVSDLEPLAGLDSLLSLYLSGNQVSNLEPLAGLDSLHSLALSGTQVSNLEPLAGLDSLLSLYLSGNQVSNLEPLAGLDSLLFLDLDGTQVRNLELLAGLDSLVSLDLSNTQVSAEEVEALKRKLPGLAVAR